jgi:arylsulfatase A-like enzyme
VLLIIIDDLRPELGSFGATHAVSPNIDALAAEGVVFGNAYAQVPVCGASRASFLSGLRPRGTRFTNFASRLDADAPDVQSLPELFRENGYVALANGKVHHHFDDGVDRWSEPPWRAGGAAEDHREYVLPSNLELEETDRGPAYESADVDDDAYTDGKTVAKSIADLERLAEGGDRFFLAVGLYRPHLPFSAPRRYWDLYDPAEIPDPEPRSVPRDAPDVALHDSLELVTQYSGLPPVGEPVGPELTRVLRHGYLASVSYSDALVGRLLAALDDLGLREETIVVILGDNGFSLGEHAMWVKHANFDRALRVPLVIRAPGFDGARIDEVVELLDVFPTLADLAGLSPPDHLDGRSLRAIMEEPDASGSGVAASRYHSTVSLDPGPWSGESIRTDRWLFTEWRTSEGMLHARMLYDHRTDPEETVNVAETVDPSVVEALSSQLGAITGTPRMPKGN